LLHLLTHKAIPYFIARHHCQALGFEGLDLELRRWTDVEAGACEIPKSDILEVDEANYHVRSCTDPDKWYNVDLDTSNCDCGSFPLVSFCKHISAVQMHFSQTCNLIPFQAEPDTTPSQSGPSSGLEAVVTSTDQQAINNDGSHFTRISHKILGIAAQARENRLSHLTPVLLNLEAGLDEAEAPLPKKIPVAPNQHTWPETAVVMVARPKTKLKTHTDPYGSSEQSGKRAKPDTRVAKASPPRYVHLYSA
jgi:hypothetical protein